MENENEKENEQHKDDSAVSAAIEELKRRAEAAEARASDLEKKNAEQEEAIRALMGDGENTHDANAEKFFSGLRYIKKGGQK